MPTSSQALTILSSFSEVTNWPELNKHGQDQGQQDPGHHGYGANQATGYDHLHDFDVSLNSQVADESTLCGTSSDARDVTSFSRQVVTVPDSRLILGESRQQLNQDNTASESQFFFLPESNKENASGGVPSKLSARRIRNEHVTFALPRGGLEELELSKRDAVAAVMKDISTPFVTSHSQGAAALHHGDGQRLNGMGVPISPHRWGARLMKQSMAPRGGGRQNRKEDSKPLELPAIHPSSSKSNRRAGGKVRVVNLRLDHRRLPSFHVDRASMGPPSMAMGEGCGGPDLLLAGKQWRYEDPRGRIFVGDAPTSSLYFDQKTQDILRATKQPEAWGSQENLHVFCVMGERQKERIHAELAATHTLGALQEEEGDDATGDHPWYSANDERFSHLSGNVTSQLRRNASRGSLSIPSNAMDFRLRYGTGVSLNGVFQAHGRQVQEHRGIANDRLQNGSMKLPIAEGLDFDELLNTIGCETKDDGSFHTSTERPQSLPVPGSAEGGQTLRPGSLPLPELANGHREGKELMSSYPLNALSKVGIVEHGSFLPAYDCFPNLYNDEGGEGHDDKGAFRVVEVSGSCPGRREIHGISARREHDPRQQGINDWRSRLDGDGDAESKKQASTLPSGAESLVNESGADRIPGFQFANADGVETGLGDFAGANSSRLRELYLMSDSDLASITQARVKEIGRYEVAFPGNKSEEELDNQEALLGDTTTDGVDSQTMESPRGGRLSDLMNRSGVDGGGEDGSVKGVLPSGRFSKKNPFLREAILPPSKNDIQQAKCLDEDVEKQVYDRYSNQTHGHIDSAGESKEKECGWSLVEAPLWENEKEERLFKRIKSKVLRMRKSCPPSDPNKLCFASNVSSCSHQEVKDSIEFNGKVTVTKLQYDPVYLEEGNPDHYVGLWIFEITQDSDKTNLFLSGFSLKGQPMNVRALDDVMLEEHRAFKMYNAIRMEQRRKKLTKKRLKR